MLNETPILHPPLSPTPSTPLRVILLISGSVALSVVYTSFNYFSFVVEFLQNDRIETFRWGSTVYFVTAGALLLPAGRLADCFGRKQVFSVGIALIVSGVSLEVVAPNGVILILGRLLHGTGNAAVLPAGLAILLALVPSNRRSTVLGAYYSMFGIVLLVVELFKFPLDPFEWQRDHNSEWIWALTAYLFIGVATLLIVGTKLKEYRDEETRNPLDVTSMILAAGAVGAFLFVIPRIQEWGWIDWRTVALLAIAPPLASLLVYRSARGKSSMLIAKEALNRSVLLANSATVAFALGTGLLYLGLSEFFVNVGSISIQTEHISSLMIGAISGLLFLPLWIGKLADRRGHRQYIFVAGMCILASSLWLGRVGSEWSTSGWLESHVILNPLAWFGALIIVAVGAGIGEVSLMGAVVRSFAPRNLSVAVAYHQTFVMLGNAFFSIAVLMLWERVGIRLASQQAWLFGVAAVAGAVVVALALGVDTRPSRDESALEAGETSELG
ncbi:MAG: MFS transporter [bacterium]|nr:MFS transporter [bacterium]